MESPEGEGTIVLRKNIFLMPEFKNGVNTFETFISPDCDYDDYELNAAIRMWADGDEVQLVFQWTLRECVQSMVSANNLYGEESPVMKSESKPRVDAMRSELLEMVALLDEVRFVA